MYVSFFLFSIALAQDSRESMGEWSYAGSSGVVCIHSFLTPNSRFLCTQRPRQVPYQTDFSTSTYPWPSTYINVMGNVNGDGTWSATYQSVPVVSNPFCSGHAQMANGSIIAVGGDDPLTIDPRTNTTHVVDGRAGRRLFEPSTGQWVELAPMTTQRWYPTLVTLADGRIIIFGGTTRNLDFDRLGGDNNPTYEYYPSKGGEWPRTLEILNWAYPHVLYPISFLMPSGKVILFVSNKTIALDPETEAVTFPVPDMPAMNHRPWIYPHTPCSVLLPMTIANNYTATLRVCGGTDLNQNASPMCWQVSPDATNPQWEQIDDMPVPRVMPNNVLLPDGTILYINGAKWGKAGGEAGNTQFARDPAREVHIYNPTAPAGQRWSNVASMQNYRLYHSSALLLETGHVIVMGSEMDNLDDYWPESSRRQDCYPAANQSCTSPFNTNIERFAPPYLYKAQRLGRLEIVQTVDRLTYGSTFTIQIKGRIESVKSISFIRYATSTHSTDTDQRFVELNIIYTGDDFVIVEAPANGNLAPPGNWMLFLLDFNNVPSVAKTINLQQGSVTKVDIPSKPSRVRNSASQLSSWMAFVVVGLSLLF